MRIYSRFFLLAVILIVLGAAGSGVASPETAIVVIGQTCEYDCSSDGWTEPNCTSDGPCCPEIPNYCKVVKCTDPREQFPAACLPMAPAPEEPLDTRD